MSPTAADVCDQIERSTRSLVGVLRGATDAVLREDSLLPGWDRLTIVCHLRYGAVALLRMTDDALAGRTTAFYPEGRTAQRPGTLVARPGESSADVVDSLRRQSDALHERWKGLTPSDWGIEIREDADNVDLGDLSMGELAVLRLTEVEVHSTDLGLPDLGPWSETFVDAALRMRLDWLPRRRRSDRPTPSGRRSWLLTPTDRGSTVLVTVDDLRITSTPAEPDTPADTVIAAPCRELLGMLLGRAAPPGSATFRRCVPGP